MSHNKTINYYEKLGSRLGYQMVLGGHRHFGWYGDNQRRSMVAAAEAMIDHLAEFADISENTRVLDAGCGQGRTSMQLATKYGAVVSGVDLVPRSINFAQKMGAGNERVDFQSADYNDLPFADETFDVVFTLETFTHSDDPEKTLKEFLRVLKPGGRIAIFDYTVAPLHTMPKEIADAIHLIAKETNCPGFDTITHDYYDHLLPKLGISEYTVVNASQSVLPGIKNMYRLSWVPYHLLELFGKHHSQPNILMGHIGYPAGMKDYIRYVTVRITK